jgi:two-component system, NarL family, nitrate/nitrite response regulator NarL
MDDLRPMYRLAYGRPTSSDRRAGDRAALRRAPSPARVLETKLLTARNRITVALIGDNRLVREALTTFLNRSPDIRVIGEGPEGHRAILQDVDPDVVLLNLGLQNGDSLRLATQVLEDFPDARVIVMDLLPAYEELSDFVTAGVSGFIMKDASLEDVLGTIRAVEAGLKVLPDQMTATLFSEIAGETATDGGTQGRDPVCLTPREREVANRIAEGMSNKAIAKELHISIHTVKSHLRNIMDKLTVDSRLQVAKYVHKIAARGQLPELDR